MQTTSTQFLNKAHASIRPLSWELKAAFDKVLDPSIAIFKLDSSLLDGIDVLAPEGSNVVQQWDKYRYTNYSDRVISLEVTREVVEPSSIVQSFADITLNNYDDYFTPNSGSPIDALILSQRPFRIFMGFGDENVSMFVGLSDKMPTIDKTARTVSFHLIDFLTILFDKEIGDSQILLGYSTSEILSYLFQQQGLLPDQYVLDDSFNRIPFFFVNKGDKLGTIVNDLMIAEQGRLYMDAIGVIRFKNRQNYSTDSVWNFNKANTIDYSVSNEDDIINSVKLTCDIMAVQSNQSVWQQSQAVLVSKGGSVDVWANLTDPVTSITTPVYSSESAEASIYIPTYDIDGTLPYPSIALTSITSFSTAIKMTFTNSGASDAYIFAIDVWGTPVKQVDTILVEDEDATSINNFGERIYAYETRYIQTKDNALSKAAIMLNDYKDYGSIVNFDVKGTPALQVDDGVNLDLDGYQGVHTITKLIDNMTNGQYRQSITAKNRTLTTYFILNKSLLNGTDVLTP